LSYRPDITSRRIGLGVRVSASFHIKISTSWDSRESGLYGIKPVPTKPSVCRCDIYGGGKVRVSEFMLFLTLEHNGSKSNFVL